MDLEFRVSICKLYTFKMVNDQVLLYSTGNYIQSLGIDYVEKIHTHTHIYVCISVAKTSNTMLNKSIESGHPCLVANFSGKVFSFFPTDYYIGCGFVINGFYYVKVSSPYTYFGSRVFVINRCWILSNAFPASIKMTMWFLTFVNVVYDVD